MAARHQQLSPRFSRPKIVEPFPPCDVRQILPSRPSFSCGDFFCRNLRVLSVGLFESGRHACGDCRQNCKRHTKLAGQTCIHLLAFRRIATGCNYADEQAAVSVRRSVVSDDTGRLRRDPCAAPRGPLLGLPARCQAATTTLPRRGST